MKNNFNNVDFDKLSVGLHNRVLGVEFGTVSVILTVHNGNITKIEYKTEEKEVVEK